MNGKKDKPVWEQLDYSHDAIIEASAGTGKTYTLEHIVCKLVKDGISIGSILLVTFTEKAAGELKDRIRAALARDGLLPADFDEATICTIHSFCRELISTYAFQNRVPMTMEVVNNDSELRERAVRTALESEAFRGQFEDDYGGLMVLSQFRTNDALVKKACMLLGDALAGKWQLGGDVAENIGSVKRRVAERAMEMKACLEKAGASLSDWAFGGVALHGSDAATAYEGYAALGNAIDTLANADSRDFISRLVLFDPSRRAFLNPRVTKRKDAKNLLDCPEKQLLAELVSMLFDAREKTMSALANGLARMALDEYRRIKANGTAMSFDDMVAIAYSVIDAEPDDSELLGLIRRKYRIALVDEFQDTDKKQWAIFKKLFSHKVNKLDGEDAPEPRQGFLLVVGDPKQAIYSFRGADIATYVQARREITEGEKDSPYKKKLVHTYRSARGLVESFNKIFSAEGWFDKRGVSSQDGCGEIEYDGVEFPYDGEFAGFEDDDRSEAAPVTLLESIPAGYNSSPGMGFGNNAMCLPVFVENAAREVKRLMSIEGGAFSLGRKIGRRPLKYGDFCFLVRSKGDAAVVKEVLSREKLPFAHYKEEGVFASAEAEALLALFDYLSSPADRGNREALLLSELFDVHPSMLGKRLAASDRELAALTDKWVEFATKRDWPRLFESVMEDTCIGHPRTDDFEFDRKWMACRQILDKLYELIGAAATSPREFAVALRALRSGDIVSGESGEVRKKETDANRVQIMTMHTAKGLEFPVVFIASGFSPVSAAAKGVSKEQRELEERETRRLIYVALTRAKCKLYLPWTANTAAVPDNPLVTYGVGSYKSALRKGFLANGILNCFGSLSATRKCVEQAMRLLDGFEPVADGGVREHSVYGGDVGSYAVPARLWHLKLQWDSYSSLGRHATIIKKEVDDAVRSDDAVRDVRSSPMRTETLLRRGNVSGDVFHEIMETLCGNADTADLPGFGVVGGADVSEVQAWFDNEPEHPFARIVRRAMRRHGVANIERDGDSTERTLARMAWNALNVEIAVGGDRFALKEIAPCDRRAEVEFVIDEKSLLGDFMPAIGGCGRQGVLNGKIDLLVRPAGMHGKTFVIDWKTNSIAGFDPEDVSDAMMDCGYDLQYKLYSLAVEKWLGDGSLGGIAYLFVRGGEYAGGRCGVFSRTAADGFLDECRRAVAEAMPNGMEGE